MTIPTNEIDIHIKLIESEIAIDKLRMEVETLKSDLAREKLAKSYDYRIKPYSQHLAKVTCSKTGKLLGWGVYA